jgi:hypothetical protein
MDEMEPDRLGRLWCKPPDPVVLARPDADESDDRKPSLESDGERPSEPAAEDWLNPLCA